MSDDIDNAAMTIIAQTIIDKPKQEQTEIVETSSSVKPQKQQKPHHQSPSGSIFNGATNSIFPVVNSSITLYKLHLYKSDGTIRTEISKALFTEIAKKYGDLVKCIPSNRWSNMDEICEFVWASERRNYLKAFTRTRKQIEDGIALCTEIGAILTK